MVIISLKIIPKPLDGTRSVLHSVNPDLPFIKGDGFDSYLCGKCGHILADQIEEGQLHNLVFECPKCNEYNDLP
jgi:hypothetical protein